jgi:hypothetical protein
MDISFQIIILLITLIISFVGLFLKNNSPNALNSFIYNFSSNYLQLILFLFIIILILIFNIKIN